MLAPLMSSNRFVTRFVQDKTEYSHCRPLLTLNGKEGSGSINRCTNGASFRMQASAERDIFLSWTSMLTLANIVTLQFLVNNLSRTK
jgi:hypothetical protein